MQERELVKGNVALARGALDAGCRFYYGYPITPQNDIPEYLSAELPRLGGVFLQAESELASINMVMGAAAAGGRVMTSSSGPGISLMQEGLSFMAGMELPAVVVNITRSGPGLGGISATQGDYHQATRGGGHGDYHLIVLAPASVQEMYDLARESFRLAFAYRNPVLILGDAMLGQMKEPVQFRVPGEPAPVPEWALTGASGREPRLIKSLYLRDGEMAVHNWKMHEKYRRLAEREARAEVICPPECRLLVAAFGSCARIARTAVERARRRGLPVGLFRPLTLFPFPVAALSRAAAARQVLVVELNTGQMVDDVRLAVGGSAAVHFRGFPGGTLPLPEEIEEAVDGLLKPGGIKACTS